jgi:hypothetical protein
LDAPRHFYLHSEKSIAVAAEKAGLKIINSCRDSWDFQFWGSEQYIKNIPLKSQNSYSRAPKRSMFSKEDISSFTKKARELNELNMGDQAIFYLAHND